ncbi:MAG: hypothetical protein K9K65_08610 [Desulfarculaceae bacterium]|nr:hypothetical protein [Desulfarculaceae bacterium]MCF8046319.1 hypothetical protein [Desulfarculaceae bacterium]MCF8097888.1 hypothetical protein [Desulfarculaceae bacterium]MCF8121613.1 hypothetical protein [Desulfarculaceae bacterium]
MAGQTTGFPHFKPTASRAQNGVAMIFDLEGFSNFFGQPDVHEYIPTYLNKIFTAIDICIFGGSAFWLDDELDGDPLIPRPVHRKFLGDGALYVWLPQKNKDAFDTNFTTYLPNRLWTIKNQFSAINKSCADDIPLLELPQRIRFGIARGTIYELSFAHSKTKEYIGYCINLASRLQNYCKELGFIVSARMRIGQEVVDKHNYLKVVATKIKGFPREIVIVDKREFESLSDDKRNDLFEAL